MVSQQSQLVGAQSWPPPFVHGSSHTGPYGGTGHNPGYYGYHGYALRREDTQMWRGPAQPPVREFVQVQINSNILLFPTLSEH